MAKDYYQILGVAKTATSDEIKKAYYNLSHQYHPDKGGNAEKFKEVNEAYRVLSDSQKRKQYDQYGDVPGDNSQGFDFSGWQNGGFNAENFDFGGFGDIFEEFFSTSGSARGSRQNGSDLSLQIEISLEDAFFGFEKEFQVEKEVECSACQGSGAQAGFGFETCKTCHGSGVAQKVIRTPFGSAATRITCPDCHGQGKSAKKICSVCHGYGITRSKETIKIKIPAGIDNGQTISYRGLGNAGKNKKPAGDLHLRVYVKSHEKFERQGSSLYFKTKVSLTKAVLGGEINLPTIDGKEIYLKIPAGTASGKVFKISGKGMSKLNSSNRGDMFVEVLVIIPEKLNKRQKEIIEDLKKEGL